VIQLAYQQGECHMQEEVPQEQQAPDQAVPEEQGTEQPNNPGSEDASPPSAAPKGSKWEYDPGTGLHTDPQGIQFHD
jgi:hypothetical protein